MEIVEAGMREGLVTEAEMVEVNHGHSTFFYRDQNVVDPSKRKQYLAFEAVFRTLPLLPKADPKQSGVAAFVQNRSTGEVLQALMLPACAG